MIWASVEQFWAMGGYGLYVWGSLGACLVVMVLEPLQVRLRHKAVRHDLRRTLRADQIEMDQV